jgi:uncharacterized protein
MVQINVSQQLKATVGSIRNYKINENVNITDRNINVCGDINLMRTDRGLLVKGTLNTEVEVTCCRCLSIFRCPLVLNIEEEYFPTTDVITGSSIPKPDEPGSFTIDEHNILDLTEAIRQYTLMAIPMKPLCRENCAGLCPSCGCNMNLVKCGCASRTIDPRWAELNKLVSVNIHEGMK